MKPWSVMFYLSVLQHNKYSLLSNQKPVPVKPQCPIAFPDAGTEPSLPLIHPQAEVELDFSAKTLFTLYTRCPIFEQKNLERKHTKLSPEAKDPACPLSHLKSMHFHHVLFSQSCFLMLQSAV